MSPPRLTIDFGWAAARSRWLASIVLEEAAGVPFPELLQQKIAAPLGLASLGVDAPRRIIPGRVRGYGRAAQVREVPSVQGMWANAPTINPAYKWAGGGLVMTPSDFARFGAAHLAPGLLRYQRDRHAG